jgi:hypothetical protein
MGWSVSAGPVAHAEPPRASARPVGPCPQPGRAGWGPGSGDEDVAVVAVTQGLAPIRSMSVSASMPTDRKAAATARKSTG